MRFGSLQQPFMFCVKDKSSWIGSPTPLYIYEYFVQSVTSGLSSMSGVHPILSSPITLETYELTVIVCRW